MATQHTEKQQILDWLAASQGDMLQLLERLVNIDSWSYDKAGVDRVGAVSYTHLRAHET